MYALLESRFCDLRFLGKGAFGEVYHGRERSNGQALALKVLPRNSAAANEIAALCQLNGHPHIVRYYRCNPLGARQICLVMEYCSGGNLNDFLLSNGPNPSRDLRFMREIASAVAFLHRNGVVHRDLKPDNILVTADGSLKVADFGLAKVASDIQHGGSLYNYYMQSVRGTKLFMAPEIFDGRFTEKADVFSMGATFACMLERKTIRSGSQRILAVYYDVDSDGATPVSLGRALHDGLPRYRLTNRINQELCILVESTLQTSHKCRPTAAEVEDQLESMHTGRSGMTSSPMVQEVVEHRKGAPEEELSGMTRSALLTGAVVVGVGLLAIAGIAALSLDSEKPKKKK